VAPMPTRVMFAMTGKEGMEISLSGCP